MDSTTPRRIIRGWKALIDKIGGSRVQGWRNVRNGLFPTPLVLSSNSVGWYEDEVDEWLASRPRRTYGAKAPYQAEEDVQASDELDERDVNLTRRAYGPAS